ncbi:MAG: DEAD/DEAH box helicase family protein [Christensenella sp.]
MQLRDYQNNLIAQTAKAYKQGYTAPCIVLPCGGGKACIAADIARRTTAVGNRFLFLVHRVELCDQIEQTFRTWGVNMALGDVAMVQTVSNRLKNYKEPQIIITDENHHAPCRTYKRIYEYFPNAKRLGITATPIRLNGQGLIETNDILIEGVSTDWLINHNFLAPYKYYAPVLADFADAKINRGEFDTADIEIRMMKKAIYGDVISTYQKLANGGKAICYCASIKHSIEMAGEFNAVGIAAVHIDGTTSKQNRADNIAQFRSGDIKILCNVDLISEGFDVPDCSAVIMLRPTQSLGLFIQQSMRCMRFASGKLAKIIDHVGNYTRHGLPDDERDWTLNGKNKRQRYNEDGTLAVRQCEKCFGTFRTAAVCPYCGAEYVVKGDELKRVQDIELKEIEKAERKTKRMEVGMCRTYEDLRKVEVERGYKRGWAYIMAKKKGIMV